MALVAKISPIYRLGWHKIEAKTPDFRVRAAPLRYVALPVEGANNQHMHLSCWFRVTTSKPTCLHTDVTSSCIATLLRRTYSTFRVGLILDACDLGSSMDVVPFQVL